MNSEPRQITNEILYEKLKRVDEVNRIEHAEIINQTTRTNGTVADIVSEIDRLKSWQNRWIGISIVASSMIVPILLYLLYLHIKP